MEQQNDITDLIPKRLGIYWLFFLCGMALIALLEFAYFKMPELAGKLGVTAIPPLDIELRGSLLNWWISFLFLMSSCVSLLNFRLSLKHQDTQNHANTWFWAAFILVFLSLDIQVGMRETIRDVLTALSGTPLYRDGTVWWLAIYGFFLGIVGTRLLPDIAAYPPSLGLYLLALSGMIAGLFMEIGFVPFFEEPVQNLILQTAVQSGSALFFFLAITTFARRQVFRDPEAAMRWFAKVWNQPSAIQPAKPQQQQPKIQQKSQPTAETEPAPTKNAVTKNTTPSERPVLQQSQESIPFTLSAPSEKDGDIKSAHTA
jgi:hypothetical protein